MFNQFDIVHINTTKRIRFMSGPPGHAASPQGDWSVVGFIDGDALIAKDSTIARVPVQDLTKIASMNINDVVSMISKAGLDLGSKFNVIDHVMRVFDIDVIKAKTLLRRHNLPLEVESKSELEQVERWLQKVDRG